MMATVIFPKCLLQFLKVIEDGVGMIVHYSIDMMEHASK